MGFSLRPTSHHTQRSTSGELLEPVIVRRSTDVQASSEIVRPHKARRQTDLHIAYRDNARHGGLRWDHESVEALTGRRTVVQVSQRQLDASKLSGEADALSEQMFGGQDKARYKDGYPRVVVGSESQDGLLIIPGGPNSLTTEKPAMRFPPKEKRKESAEARDDHQAELLRLARLRGQPILGVCGGTWHVAQAFGGNTETSPEFEQRHLTPAMPAFDPNYDELHLHHEQITQHAVVVDPDSLLGTILRPAPAYAKPKPKPKPKPKERHLHLPAFHGRQGAGIHLNVNSVHWAHLMTEIKDKVSGKQELSGVDPHCGDLIQGNAAKKPAPTATSDLLKINARDSRDRTVEGVEMLRQPVIAVQHHPEALAGKPLDVKAFPMDRYQREHDDSVRIFNWMAQAGDAYADRRDQFREIEGLIDSKRKGKGRAETEPTDTIESSGFHVGGPDNEAKANWFDVQAPSLAHRRLRPFTVGSSTTSTLRGEEARQLLDGGEMPEIAPLPPKALPESKRTRLYDLYRELREPHTFVKTPSNHRTIKLFSKENAKAPGRHLLAGLSGQFVSLRTPDRTQVEAPEQSQRTGEAGPV